MTPEASGSPDANVADAADDKVSVEGDRSAEVAETVAEERMIALSLDGIPAAGGGGQSDPSPEVAQEPAPEIEVQEGDEGSQGE